MRALVCLLLTGCATAAVTVKPVPAQTPPALPALAVCPKAAVPFVETATALGAIVEKVCLVGASEDSYLRLHELVAPREGAVVNARAVREDIEALFQQNLLKDVVVVAQPLASRGVMLIYLVTEYEWITQVDYTGVKAVKPDEFRELARAGMRASPFVLKTLGDTVKSLYAGLGYPDAKISSRVKSLGGGNAALSLEVEEGPQLTVGAISFRGTKQLPEADLRKALLSAVGFPYLEDLASRDTLAVTTVYFDHGMVNVSVVNSISPLPAPPGAVELTFEVKEGDVFRLGKVTLTGFSLGVEKEVLKAMEAKPKSIFSRSALQRDMERLRDRARLQGHVVEITPMTTVDAEKKTIDVSFELSKKPGGKVSF